MKKTPWDEQKMEEFSKISIGKGDPFYTFAEIDSIDPSRIMLTSATSPGGEKRFILFPSWEMANRARPNFQKANPDMHVVALSTKMLDELFRSIGDSQLITVSIASEVHPKTGYSLFEDYSRSEILQIAEDIRTGKPWKRHKADPVALKIIAGKSGSLQSLLKKLPGIFSITARWGVGLVIMLNASLLFWCGWLYADEWSQEYKFLLRNAMMTVGFIQAWVAVAMIRPEIGRFFETSSLKPRT